MNSRSATAQRRSFRTGAAAVCQLFRTADIWLSLKETAEANDIDDPIKWLTKYGRAWYRYCAEKTLTKEVTDNGRSLNSKLMKFNPGASEGFDYKP